MGSYHRLTQAERYQIEALTRSGKSIRDIAKLLGRNPGSISRELQRNGPNYRATEAIELTKLRRSIIGPRKKIRGELEEQVKAQLALDLSPEQVAGALRRERIKISHETIYKFIYSQGHLSGLLRWKRKKRRKRSTTRNFKKIGKRSDRTWIDERPTIVDRRSRCGDFERDTMEGIKGGAVLLTMVDRKSRLTRIRCVEKKGMKIHYATLESLKDLKVKTITNDNGPEFSEHGLTAMDLKAPIFFTKPYCSWQRGTNENTNGLIRQYFKRGTEPTPELASFIEHRLNNRPRKCLGYRTPNEVHRIQSDVALSS